MPYTIYNVGFESGQSFDTLEEAEKEMCRIGYAPLDEYSCDGSASYWIDIDHIPGDDRDASNLSPEWIDSYIRDGAYTPQIVEEEDA